MGKNVFPYALLINDIHVDKNNIAEFHKNWNEAVSICKERGIKEIIIGGDLWTNRSAQTLPVLMAVREAIIHALNQEILLVIAEGNHDLIDQEQLAGYSHLFSEYPDVIVVDDFSAEELQKDLYLITMSYFPENGSFLEKLAEVREFTEPSDTILYIHEGVNGAISTNSDKELPASAFKDFKKVLVGHYHDRAQVGDNIFYIGASRQHNFGEDEEKGYTIIYSDGSTEFVKNQVNARFKTLVYTLDQLERAKDRIKELVDEGSKVRVQVECQSEEAVKIDKKTLLEIGASKVEVKTAETEIHNVSQAIETKFDKSGIKKEYIDFCAKKDVDDVETGLRYLDKIN